MAIEIPCSWCGPRPFTEFSFGGEWRELEAPDPESDFARVYLPENPEGWQRERWFHAMGCRTWTTVTRDTRTNAIEGS
ncbi:MAG TPA: sarcosine oxidase subunit delta [Actinomycetota bacterium]